MNNVRGYLILLPSSIFIFTFCTGPSYLWVYFTLLFSLQLTLWQTSKYIALKYRYSSLQCSYLPLRFWILCHMPYYNQSDLFREAPRNRQVKALVSEGKLGLEPTWRFLCEFYSCFFPIQGWNPQCYLFPSLVSLLSSKLLFLPGTSQKQFVFTNSCLGDNRTNTNPHHHFPSFLGENS